MSKPNSGHFKGTTGINMSYKKWSLKNHNSAIINFEGLDLREHPTKYKQLSSRRLKILREKEAARTITKSEYKQLDWQKRLDARRKAGIDAFWNKEKILIKRNMKTTRNWSSAQKADIMHDKRPKYKGFPIQSHHTYSVTKFPHLANLGFLIYPVTKYEHTNRWHARNFKTSLPGKPMNNNIKEEF